MSSTTGKANPIGRKVYTDPHTGETVEGAIVPLAKIRADAIWAQVKPYLSQHEIFGNRLLIGIFKTEKTREIAVEGGGSVKLELPETYVQEDVWQGVTGLVIQAGPGCFQDSDKWKFHGQKAEVGDWITFQPAHTLLIKLGGRYDGIECRIIQDCYVLAKVAGPHVCI